MKKLISSALAAAFIFGILVLPNHPDTMQLSALTKFPIELPVILLAMIVAGRWWGVRAVFAVTLVLAAILKLADFAMFSAYNRTFNPIVDAFLIDAGIGLLGDSIGKPLTYLAVAVAIVVLVLTFFAVLRSLRVWAGIQLPTYGKLLAAIATIGFGGWAVADVGHHVGYWTFEKSPPGTAWTSRLVIKRT